MLDTLIEAQFAPYVGEKFRVQLAPSTVLELELVEVSRIDPKGGRAAGRREPFSVLFRGPLETPLSQRTYTLAHEQMGVLDLFLVPIAPDDDGRYYEAVFA